MELQNNNIDTIIQHAINILETGASWEVEAPQVLQEQQDTSANVVAKVQDASPMYQSLEHVTQEILVCNKCKLCTTRTHTVPGVGVSKPTVLVVGEAPGAQEDLQGQPFVGKSGQYLDKWLAAIKLSRDTNVFITNTIKCRPPNNRNPDTHEVQQCNPYLLAQIELLKPKLILALGKVAGHILTGNSQLTLGNMRGKEYVYHNIPLYVTYHPSAVLRNPDGLRRVVWEDLQQVEKRLSQL